MNYGITVKDYQFIFLISDRIKTNSYEKKNIKNVEIKQKIYF